jgi:hypothetical protein
MKAKMLELIALISGMRKTLVMFLLIVLGVAFRLTNYIDGGQFVDLLKGTVIAFFSANSIEHIGATIKEFINAKGQKVDEFTTDEGVKVDEVEDQGATSGPKL